MHQILAQWAMARCLAYHTRSRQQNTVSHAVFTYALFLHLIIMLDAGRVGTQHRVVLLQTPAVYDTSGSSRLANDFRIKCIHMYALPSVVWYDIPKDKVSKCACFSLAGDLIGLILDRAVHECDTLPAGLPVKSEQVACMCALPGSHRWQHICVPPSTSLAKPMLP